MKASNRPFCLCGCGRRVKRNGYRYFSHACVTRAGVRGAGGQLGRQRFIAKQQALRYGPLVDRMVERGKVTRGEILAALAEVYRWGYHNGWHARANRRAQAAKARQAA